jgi:hypothetical protein
VEDLTAGRPPGIALALAAKRGAPEDVFDHFGEGADLIVGLGNGEPVTVIDALERARRGSRASLSTRCFPCTNAATCTATWKG